jgi:hypothetical protein
LESRQKGGTWDRRLSLDDGLNVGLVTEKSVRVRIHDEMAPSNVRCFNSLLSRFSQQTRILPQKRQPKSILRGLFSYPTQFLPEWAAAVDDESFL